jgi:cytochrome c oxidase cbb3-type subunit 4
MLRFIKHNLTNIDGIEFYPLLSLLIFVIFFAIVITMVIRMTKAEVTELSDIPFEKDAAGEYKQ